MKWKVLLFSDRLLERRNTPVEGGDHLLSSHFQVMIPEVSH